MNADAVPATNTVEPSRANPPQSVLSVLHDRFGLVPTPNQLPRIAQQVVQMQRRWLPTDPVLLASSLRSAPWYDLRPLIAAATVNESYFFRDSRQIALLRHEILPRLIARRRADNSLHLRVWSAAAAAGQELFTVAMMLQEILPDIRAWDIDLVGTDIDADILDKARSGQFSKRDLRATPDDIRERYFTPAPPGYRLSSAILRSARFREASITDTAATQTVGPVDLVLCRNVLIYFDADSSRRAVGNLAAQMAPDGFLLFGHAEMFSDPPAGLQLDSARGIFFYRPTACPAAALCRPPSVDVARAPAPQPPPAPPTPPAREPDPQQDAEQVDLIDLLRTEQWSRLLRATEHPERTATQACYRVLALEGLGWDRDAAEAMEATLERHPKDPEVHYLSAIISIDRGHPTAAAAQLRRTLYLRRDFPEAQYRFGLVLLDLGHTERAVSAMRRAIRLLSVADPMRSVLFEPELRYGAVVAWLEAALGSRGRTPATGPEAS